MNFTSLKNDSFKGRKIHETENLTIIELNIPKSNCIYMMK